MISRIYAVKSRNSNKVYIGATSRSLSARLAELKASFKTYIHRNEGNYSRAFDVLSDGDTYIELLLECDCGSMKDRNILEGMFIREYSNRYQIVNHNMAGGSINSYYYRKINNLA
jgi:hypothetical protein